MMSHELEGHAVLLADLPSGHRPEKSLRAQALAVHEGWSDAHGMFRTGSPHHGEAPGLEAHRHLDSGVMVEKGETLQMPRTVTEYDELRARLGTVPEHRGSGVVSNVAWNLAEAVGRDRAADVFWAARGILRDTGGSLDFASVGEALDGAATLRLTDVPGGAGRARDVLRAAGFLLRA